MKMKLYRVLIDDGSKALLARAVENEIQRLGKIDDGEETIAERYHRIRDYKVLARFIDGWKDVLNDPCATPQDEAIAKVLNKTNMESWSA